MNDALRACVALLVLFAFMAAAEVLCALMGAPA